VEQGMSEKNRNWRSFSREAHLTNADLQRSMEAEKQVMQHLRNVKANPTSLANAQLDVKFISFKVPTSGKI
jgi:hypothetical protein